MDLISQIKYIGAAVLAGGVGGFVWDILRAKRRTVGTGTVAAGVEDLLYCMASGAWIYGLMLYIDGGMFRVNILMFYFIGFTVYLLTLGRLLLRFNTFLFGVIKKIILFIVKILFYPVKIFVRMIYMIRSMLTARRKSRVEQEADTE